MEINNNYVKIPNDMYDDLSLTNEEVTIILLSYRNYMLYKNYSLCSLKLIAEDYMKYELHNNRDILPKIKETIASLIEKEYILDIYNINYEPITTEDIKDKYFNFYIEMKEPPMENYFQVFDSAIISIFNGLKGEKLNKFNLIRYYLACCRVRNQESNVGFLAQSKMKYQFNKSKI